ncbi:hypothetical protein AK812_SmicGene21547 [Symbiodinium microadriaticum]|uniref:Uncharacterized protein n=1 Tax=Symbiodinium microadriaticum TaxID=2951 RepID=A0A1Q9DM81_SYMMI|nr:hypothetical protein AK812_SmicGene21547 [Symbiodinium microadriaticum]
MRSHVTRTPQYAGTSRQEVQGIAAEAFDSEATDLVFAYPLPNSALHELVHQGFSIRGVLAATIKSASGGSHGIVAFIDSRPLSGFTVFAQGTPGQDREVHIFDQCTIVLSLAPSDTVSLPHRCLSAPPKHHDTPPVAPANDHAGHEVDVHGPTVFNRENIVQHDPTVLLGLEEPDEEEPEHENIINAGFMIFVPRFIPETVYVALQAPCNLDRALGDVDHARQSHTSVHFDRLIPAVPQPDPSFGAVLAVPSWANHLSFVLIDTRRLDGRLFALEIRGRLNRSSLLQQVGVNDDGEVDVFLHGRALDAVNWFQFLSGDVVQLLPRDCLPPPPTALADMLRGPEGWTYPCPCFDGPAEVAFLVLTDGGHRVVPVDTDAIQSSRAFKAEVSKIVGYSYDNEPTGSTPAEQSHLDTLRSIANALGGPWLPRLPHDLQHLLQDSDDESDQDDTDDTLAQVTCSVLAPDFAPAWYSIEIHMPATTEEVVTALQLLRPERMRSQLPNLVPVLPQPRATVATFISVPTWSLKDQWVCFDCTRVDHRLYCTRVPEYVTLQRLLDIADFPPTLHITVWAGTDQHLLGPDEVVHTFPGMLFCFLHDGEEPQIPITLGQLLQFRSWNSPGELPEPRTIHAYCLVYDRHAQLFISDPYLPARHRQHIAIATGADLTRMRLYAGSPRPVDAATNGVVCKTILAVGDRHRSLVQPAWHLALLDCRLIGLSWRTVTVEGGTFNIGQVLEDLDHHAPHGWHTVLLEDRRQIGRIEARPGQIFSLVFSPGDSHTRLAAAESVGRGTSGEDTSENHSGPGYETGREEPSSIHARSDQRQVRPQERASGSDSGPVHAYASQQDQALDRDTPVPFLVFSQEYWPELVVVRLALPTGVQDAIAAVEQARDAVDHRGCSRLIPVFPQSRERQACLIAVPSWPFEGIAVLVDNRVASGGVFAVLLPRATSREALLRIAGLPDDSSHDVYLRDTPWPCTNEQVVYLSQGDLILICSSPRRPDLFDGLDQFLRVDRRWDRCPSLPGDVDNLSLVLSDGTRREAQIESDAFAANSNMVAQRLDLPPGQFTLVPASPPITDHARAGTLSANVLIACDTADYQPEQANDRTPYILDLRPILLYLSFAYAEDATVDVSVVGRRLVTRCPPGFHLRLSGGRYHRDAGNHYRTVHPGEVLKAEFLPDYVRAITIADQPDSPFSADAGQGDEHRQYGPPHQSPDSSGGDAGNGAVCSNAFTSQESAIDSTPSLSMTQCKPEHLPFLLGIAHDKLEACPGARVETWALSLIRNVLVDGPAMLTTFLFHCTCFCLAVSSVSLLCLLATAAKRKNLLFLTLLLFVHCATVSAMQIHKNELPGPTAYAHGFDTIPVTPIGQIEEPPRSIPIQMQPRAIATPCRARSHQQSQAPYRAEGGDSLYDFLQEPLTTLLEECVWGEYSHAFFDASTLLEVLVEHFAASSIQEERPLWLVDQQSAVKFGT